MKLWMWPEAHLYPKRTSRFRHRFGRSVCRGLKPPVVEPHVYISGNCRSISWSRFLHKAPVRTDIHMPNYIFAPNRQVCDEEELLPAFSHIGLYR